MMLHVQNSNTVISLWDDMLICIECYFNIIMYIHHDMNIHNTNTNVVGLRISAMSLVIACVGRVGVPRGPAELAANQPTRTHNDANVLFPL